MKSLQKLNFYKKNDLDEFSEDLPNILSKVYKRSLEVLEPKGSEIDAIYKIIFDFIREKKRKIYGGYALHKLLQSVDKNDGIYPDYEYPDVDFYSFEPLNDLVELSNILYDKGFTYILAREAMHKETYTLRVKDKAYCDISYVPKNIYHNLPFKTINGLNYIDPLFMMIDSFRMINDPLVSYWRIEKAYNRFYKLQSKFPLQAHENLTSIAYSNNKAEVLLFTKKALKNRECLLPIGFLAYHHYCDQIVKEGILKKHTPLNIPYLEYISCNYKEDCLHLLSKLKEQYGEEQIQIKEHYPFFQFYGYSAKFFWKNELICIIYHHNKKCYPYVKIGDTVVGASTLVNMYALMSIIYYRVNKHEQYRNTYYSLLSEMIRLKELYLEYHDITFLDESIFQEFVVDCIGETITAEREKTLRILYRKKKNKPYIYQYDPSIQRKENESNYKFANSSGNEIINPRNKKLLSDADLDDDHDDDDDDTSETEKKETENEKTETTTRLSESS